MDSSGIVHAKYVSDPDDFEVEEELFRQNESEIMSQHFQQQKDNNDDDDDTLLSPDTNEFLVLEQQVLDEEQRDHFQSTPTRNSCSAPLSKSVENQGPSIIVRTASYTERSPSSLEQEHLLQLEQQKQLLQSELESKLEERKRSIDAAENLVMDEEGQLQVNIANEFFFFFCRKKYFYLMSEVSWLWLVML
jgi:hypothetical protein